MTPRTTPDEATGFWQVSMLCDETQRGERSERAILAPRPTRLLEVLAVSMAAAFRAVLSATRSGVDCMSRECTLSILPAQV